MDPSRSFVASLSCQESSLLSIMAEDGGPVGGAAVQGPARRPPFLIGVVGGTASGRDSMVL